MPPIRVPAFAILAVLLMAGAATAILPEVAVPVADSAPATATTDPSTAPLDGLHLLMRIVNDGAAFEGNVQVKTRDGTVVTDHPVSVASRAIHETRLPVAEGQFVAAVRIPVARYSVGDFIDTTGCAGAFLATITRASEGFMDVGPSGCTHEPEGVARLRDAARAEAEKWRIRTRDVQPGAPGDADAGMMLHWNGLAKPTPANAREAAFQWRPGPVMDGWGRRVEGNELAVQIEGVWTSTRSDSDGRTATARLENPTHVARYAAGSLAPFAATLRLGAGTRGDSAYTGQVLDYDAPEAPFACPLRNGFQTGVIREGAAHPGNALCIPGVTLDDGAQWIAGEVATREGRDAIPLDLDTGAIVARVWFATGIPYPLAMEWYARDAAGVWTAGARQLERYQPGSVELGRATAPATGPPAITLVPIDPLDGPDPGAGTTRIAFALGDASYVARNDPTLGTLQALLAKPNAALAGAVLTVGHDARFENETAGRFTWTLAFAASGSDPVYVSCSRSGTAVANNFLSVAGRCEPLERAPVDLRAFLTAPEGFDATQLPSTGVSWNDAMKRWIRLSGGDPDALATYAAYRGFTRGPDAPAQLAVGIDFPTESGISTASPSDVADHVVLRLEDGRTLLHTNHAGVAAAFLDLPAGLGSRAAVDDGQALAFLGRSITSSTVIATVGVVGLGALVAAAFYTRLKRTRILELDARRAIHAAVEEEPGIHANAVGERIGRTGGQVDYHLDVLVREGAIVMVREGGFRRYFVTGRYAPDIMQAMGALKSGHASRVYTIIRNDPGITLSGVSEATGMSLPATSKTVARLVEAGVILRSRQGRTVALQVNPNLRLPEQDSPVAAP